MQLAYHYLRLRSRFADAREGQPIPVSLQQLAEILVCTNRNANLLLKRMIDMRWIEWSSGNGRGHLSQLTFLVSKEDLLSQSAKELVKKGDISQALELLHQQEASPAFMKQFMEWLNGQFGYRSEAIEQQRVDTLRLPLSKKRWALDPAYALFSNEAHFIRQIFDTLITYNRHTKQMEPKLAHYWEANDDRTEWTFYLRKGVLFHHRRALAASDVVFSLQRMIEAEPPSPFRWMFAHIQQMKILGSHAFKVKLQEPNHLFLHFLSSHAASILPEDMFQKLGPEFSRLPVGTGPFQVTAHDRSSLILDAFPDYFEKRAHLDRVEIWLIPELEQYQPELATDAYQMRYFSYQPSDGISPDWQEAERLQNGCRFLSLNLAKAGPQQHPSFRQALRLGIDRGELIHDQEHTIIANRLFPEYEETNMQADFNPAKARRLLNEAGYRGEPLLLSTFPHHEQAAFIVQQQCKQIGIHLNISIQPVEEFITMQEVKKADIALCDVVFDENIILSLMELLHTEQSFIHGFLDPPLLAAIEREIASCLREPNHSRQLAGLLQLEQKLIELGVIFPLSRRRQKTYFHPALKGVSPRSFGWADFNEIWFQPEYRD